MNLKAIFLKIVSWFKGEAQTVEHEVIAFADRIGNEAWELTKDGTLKIFTVQPQQDTTMSTPTVAPASTNTNVDSAIKIALFLKALDANLTDAAVQAATNAALAAAYPAA